MAFQLRCPKCRKAFPWKPTDAMPTDCPLCWESISEERADDDIVMPFIRSAKTDRTDKLYRDMEAGSEQRAVLGAQAAGCSVQDMAGLKMTDMKDNQREGDIAAVLTPSPDEAKFFQPNGAEYMAGNASGAVNINGRITTGIEPRAGATAINTVRNVMGQGPWQVATVK